MFTTDAICRLLNEQEPNENGTKELLHTVFLADKNYIVRKPKEPYQTNELEWFISQSRNVEDLKSFAGFIPKIWNDIADVEGIINSNYGWCCLSKENGSQFYNAMKHLEKDKNSRRAIMIYNRPSMHNDWSVGRISKSYDKPKVVKNYSWHYLIGKEYKELRGDFMCCQNNHFIIRDNKLIMTVHMRSLDAVYGYNADYIWFDWIFNKAVQYLKKTYPELERGEMVIYADSVHVYERHYEDLKKEATFGAKEKSYFEVIAEREKSENVLKNVSANMYLNDPENNANEELKDSMVEHPKHYNGNSIEHWDYVTELGYGYLLGCASKYVFRNRHKGSKNQDLDKVLAYCEKFVKSFNQIRRPSPVVSVSFFKTPAISIIIKLEDLTQYEKNLLQYIDQLNMARNREECRIVLESIKEEIEVAKSR